IGIRVAAGLALPGAQVANLGREAILIAEAAQVLLAHVVLHVAALTRAAVPALAEGHLALGEAEALDAILRRSPEGTVAIERALVAEAGPEDAQAAVGVAELLGLADSVGGAEGADAEPAVRRWSRGAGVSAAVWRKDEAHLTGRAIGARGT